MAPRGYMQYLSDGIGRTPQRIPAALMSSRSAENVCHISLVLPESAEEFFKFHQKGIAYSPLEPSVMVNFSLVSEASSVPATC